MGFSATITDNSNEAFMSSFTTCLGHF